MRKILSIILITFLMISLVACANNKTEQNNEVTGETNQTINTETIVAETDKVEVFIDNTFEHKISFLIPTKFQNQYHQKMQSNFSDGYYAITIGVKDTDYDLFTIYCTKNKNLSEFESKKGYELLGKDDVYSYIWFEYEYTLAEGAQKPQLAIDFETEYKNIKSSFSVD